MKGLNLTPALRRKKKGREREVGHGRWYMADNVLDLMTNCYNLVTMYLEVQKPFTLLALSRLSPPSLYIWFEVLYQHLIFFLESVLKQSNGVIR